MGKKVAAVVAIAKKAPTAGRQNAGSGIGQKLTTLLGRRIFQVRTGHLATSPP
jgi:hypothetical protein